MRYLLLLVIILAGCSRPSSSARPLPSVKAVNLSVATLMEEYGANPAAAGEKYLGTKVQLLGNVDSVQKAGRGDRCVVIRRPNEPSGSFAVHCYFDPYWDSLLAELRNGDSFDNHHQLIGTLDRDGEQLVLRQCSVEIHRQRQ